MPEIKFGYIIFLDKKSGLNKDKVAKSKVGDFCRASGKHHHCFCKEPSYGNNDFH